MFANMMCESIAAQHCQQRLQEAETERSLEAVRNEQRDERQRLDTRAPIRDLRRAWSALYSFVSSLA